MYVLHRYHDHIFACPACLLLHTRQCKGAMVGLYRWGRMHLRGCGGGGRRLNKYLVVFPGVSPAGLPLIGLSHQSSSCGCDYCFTGDPGPRLRITCHNPDVLGLGAGKPEPIRNH